MFVVRQKGGNMLLSYQRISRKKINKLRENIKIYKTGQLKPSNTQLKESAIKTDLNIQMHK